MAETIADSKITEAKNLSSIEILVKNVRKTPIFKQLVPMEAVSGWPIPSRRNNRVYVTLPFYGAQNQEKGKTALYPPLALITVDCLTLAVVKYVNMRYDNPWPQGNWQEIAGYFPHEAISKMTIREYKAKKKELMFLYDKIIQCLINGKQLDADTDAKFSAILTVMMEPGLKPFYQAINPNFFNHFIKD